MFERTYGELENFVRSGHAPLAHVKTDEQGQFSLTIPDDGRKKILLVIGPDVEGERSYYNYKLIDGLQEKVPTIWMASPSSLLQRLRLQGTDNWGRVDCLNGVRP